jgi:hypothetical protein
VDRRLPCHYPILRIRHRNNLRPSTQQFTPDTSCHLSNNVADVTSLSGFLQPTELIDWNEVEGNGGLLDTLHSSFDNANLASSHDTNGDSALLLWETHTSDSLSSFVPALDPNDTSNNINGKVFRINNSASIPGSISPRDSSSLTRETFRPRNNLPRHLTTSTNAAKALTHRVLRGQIRGYPEMMIRGVVLPPFIHPQCVLRDQSIQDCISDAGVHSCLPEPLAICASLMHMFFTKSDTSSAFVKMKIYEEHCRLYRDVSLFVCVGSSPLCVLILTNH